MDRQPIFEIGLNGGTQEIYRFENGYGASVLRGCAFAYGGLELAVVKFHGEEPIDFSLSYDTPITNKLIGYLSEQALAKILDDIEALPAAEPAA